jgi:hypothetical protein
VQRITKGARRGVFEGSGAIVTKTLVGLNIAVYVITAAQGAGINSPGGSLFAKWVLFGPAVANGDWWRLITSSFLHASLIHRVQHVFPLVRRRARRDGARAGPLPARLHRLRAGGLRGRPRLTPTSPTVGASERSSGSSARRSCSSVSAITCSAAPLSRSC